MEASQEPTTISPLGNTSEAGAISVLRLVADFPGEFGRLRASRICGGFPVPTSDAHPPTLMARYSNSLGWPLREFIALTDALIQGGLITQTSGMRPTLVLTRAGFRALTALEGN